MDIRNETYAEGLKRYLGEIGGIVGTDMEPEAFIKRHELESRLTENVNPADFPTGTFFAYPGNGFVYVKEPA